MKRKVYSKYLIMGLAVMIDHSMNELTVNLSNKKEEKFWQNFGKKSGKNKKGASINDANPFLLFGGPYWNRTNNLLIKSQLLCLVELTARQGSFGINFDHGCQIIFGVFG